MENGYRKKLSLLILNGLIMNNKNIDLMNLEALR